VDHDIISSQKNNHLFFSKTRHFMSEEF